MDENKNRKPNAGDVPDDGREKTREEKRRRPRGIYVFARIAAILLILASTFYFVWGRNSSGRAILMQSISAEDATRGYAFGPVWLKGGVRYLSRLTVEIPESGEFWETTLAVLDSKGAEVDKETVYLAATAPEFAKGRRTSRSNAFVLRGDSGWYSFRFQQVNGVYPRPGVSGPPVAVILIREGVANPGTCWLVLIFGWILGIALFIWPR